MNHPDWQRAKELCRAARGLEAEARRQFLDKECAGDAELREEVEQLLDPSVTETLTAKPSRRPGLNQGDMLGHFRIEAQVGKGGFGLVYRATDTQLRRTVAIKILRDGSGSGAASRLRFAREAVAASALNHSNIVTVYQTGSEAGLDYIVMEYISGETLRSQIGRHGLPVAKCLRYAAEIADAVAAAHEAGIVHRDLKPGNVMINERGRVKVLDFGLAKASAPGDAGSPEAAGGAALTAEGALVGTYAYMSPEQAEGKLVDARSDIFSFGCMLYEMIAGRQPFHAESRARTLSAILDKEPPPIGTIARGLPRELEHVIEGSLRKDPRERWQNLADVKKLLEHSLKDMEAGTGTADAPAIRRYGFAPVVAGALSGALLACLGLWLWKGKDLRAPVSPEPVVSMLTADAGLSAWPALSKDGKMLAYASDRSGDGNLDIWVQQIGTREPIRLTHWDSDESDPDFSPDGTRIAFRSEKDGGGVYVTSTFGGEPVLAVQGGRNPKFSPDGRWIAFWSGREAGAYMPGSAKTFLMPVGGGQPQALGAEFAAALYPVWAPTGDSIMILGRKEATDVSLSSLDWWVIPLEKGAARRTGALQRIKAEKVGLPAGHYWNIPLVWLGSPDRVLFSGTLGDAANLWELPFASGMQVAGAPRRVTFGSAYETQMARADPSQKESRLAYASLSLNFDIWSVPLDAERGAALGEMKRVTQEVSREWWPSLSWDGTRLAFWSRQARQSSLRIRDLRSGRETTILSDTQGVAPRISGDGLQVFYTDTLGNAYQIASRGGVARTLCQRCGSPTDANSDGSRVLLEPLDSPEDIRLFDTASGKISQLVPARENLFGARWSKDERWVAFHGLYPGSETSRLYISALGNGHAPAPEEWIPITAGKSIDRDPAWSPEGRVLYFLSERDGFRCVWAQRLDPAKKTPLGEQFCVQHFHTARRTMSRVGARGDAIGLSISGGLAVFALGELTGNIWLREEKH